MEDSLSKLFRLLELTRAQPQYGYVLAEIPKSEISDLAQHHYLVTIIAWQLARTITRAGGTIDTEKVLEISLIHDLGELFGGDIAMPYAQANPTARQLAKKFEAENLKYLAHFFGDDAAYFEELAAEAMQPTSTEGLVAKIADYIEVTHYKLYVHCLTKADISMVVTKMQAMAGEVKDAKTSKILKDFIANWASNLGDGQTSELFEKFKE